MVMFLFFIIFGVTTYFPADKADKNQNNIIRFKNLRKIIIDPGHGGVNLGALSAIGIREKKITLSIALKLKKFLDQNTDLEIILTRTDDSSLSLAERVQFANKHKGDLFVSLHCNSVGGAIASGVETFFLSEKATDEITAQLCALENLIPENPEELTGKMIFNLPIQKILKDITFQANHELSEKLGVFMVNNLAKTLNLINRGVKQAPFGVLKRLQMPGIVLEMGFISNPDEAEYILSDSFLRGLEKGFLQTLIDMENYLDNK